MILERGLMIKIWCTLLLIFTLSFPVMSAAQAQSSIPQQTLQQYISDLQKNPDDTALREKIIRHVLTMRPAPAVPEEAERYLARGMSAVKGAKDEQGYLRAANEFRQALKIAPWLADGYYNLGVVLDKGGKYPEAIRSLKLYVLAAPSAADAKEAKRLVYEIEYRQEEAQRASQPPDITGTWTRWKDGKWITTKEVRMSGRTIEIKYVNYGHPSIPPDSAFRVFARDVSFDGKSFKTAQLPISPRAKNWQLTVMNKDLLIEEWLEEGGETVTYWESGVKKQRISTPESYRIEWRRVQ